MVDCTNGSNQPFFIYKPKNKYIISTYIYLSKPSIIHNNPNFYNMLQFSKSLILE